MQFLSRASALDLTVCKPWGDSARFDFVVANAGGCHRIQVKSVTWQRRRAYTCTLAKRKPYRLGEFDFLAVYIIPEALWYIIPGELVCYPVRSLYLAPHRSDSKYYKYLEAWYLLLANRVAECASPCAGRGTPRPEFGN
jgi:hypothetical protein